MYICIHIYQVKMFYPTTKCKLKDGELKADLFVKPTDTHQFLDPTSTHLYQCKKIIPYC